MERKCIVQLNWLFLLFLCVRGSSGLYGVLFFLCVGFFVVFGHTHGNWKADGSCFVLFFFCVYLKVWDEDVLFLVIDKGKRSLEKGGGRK